METKIMVTRSADGIVTLTISSGPRRAAVRMTADGSRSLAVELMMAAEPMDVHLRRDLKGRYVDA